MRELECFRLSTVASVHLARSAKHDARRIGCTYVCEEQVTDVVTLYLTAVGTHECKVALEFVVAGDILAIIDASNQDTLNQAAVYPCHMLYCQRKLSHLIHVVCKQLNNYQYPVMWGTER
jgi:hypothetical protein